MDLSLRQERWIAFGIFAVAAALIYLFCFECHNSGSAPSTEGANEVLAAERADSAIPIVVPEAQPAPAARLPAEDESEIRTMHAIANALVDLPRAPTAEDNEMLRVIAEIAEVKLVSKVRLEPEIWRLIREQYNGLNEVVQESEAKVDALAREIKEKRLEGVSGVDYEVQELKVRGPGGGWVLPPIARYLADEVVVEEIQGSERKLVRISPGDDPAFDKLRNRFESDRLLRKTAFTRLLYEHKLVR